MTPTATRRRLSQDSPTTFYMDRFIDPANEPPAIEAPTESPSRKAAAIASRELRPASKIPTIRQRRHW